MIGKYLMLRPGNAGSVMEEWKQCLNQLVDRRGKGDRLIKLNVFIDTESYDSFLETSSAINKQVLQSFGSEFPACAVTVHPPEKPWKVVVEAGYADSASSEIVSKMWKTIPYVVCNSASGKEIWASGLGTGRNQSDTRKAAESAFEQLKEVLDAENMTFDNIVRQWNYIGNILGLKDGFQNYQVFNEVRSEYYNKYRKVHGYPAATGIGMKLGGVIIDFCAVQAIDGTAIIPVDNPNQVNAYEYGQNVLKGMPCGGKAAKHPPQFERALLLNRKPKSSLFISGTASIIGQETIGIDDVEQQTNVTIGNISKLADKKRFGGEFSENGHKWGDYSVVRVYIRNQDDFGSVKDLCNQKFPGATQVFIESDICRDDLLVEIEAEFLINN